MTALECNGVLFSGHVLKAMITRLIRAYEVEEVISYGEIIKFYSTDRPYPSYLLFKFVNGRPIHVVAGKNPETNECIIITCYEPDPTIWLPGFKEKNELL